MHVSLLQHNYTASAHQSCIQRPNWCVQVQLRARGSVWDGLRDFHQCRAGQHRTHQSITIICNQHIKTTDPALLQVRGFTSAPDTGHCGPTSILKCRPITDFLTKGDEVLVISLPEPGSKFMEGAQLLAASSNDELYLVLRGRAQCHIVTMRHSQESSWLAPLPGHSCAEKITLSVVRRVAREDCELLLEGEFFYQYDSAYYLAQFLINSVNNPHALDDLELIKSDHFDLANEILSTLDQRLSSALRHTMLPDGWHLLGSEQ
ncbi:hypothetical protein BaRGS_00007057, partial [Batillaria attramentaria]